MDLFDEEYSFMKIIAVSFVFLLCIVGLRILPPSQKGEKGAIINIYSL